MPQCSKKRSKFVACRCARCLAAAPAKSVAMGSLVFLAVLSLLAFLTPLLPLQSPYQVDIKQIFATPTATPLFLSTLKIPKSDQADGTE